MEHVRASSSRQKRSNMHRAAPHWLQASRLIDQLKRRERSAPLEIAADREQTSALHGEHAPSCAVRDDEITGYRPHAHWRHTRHAW